MLKSYINILLWRDDLLRRDDGATMVEYGLMVSLIAIVALLAVTVLGVEVKAIFCNIAGSLKGGTVTC